MCLLSRRWNTHTKQLLEMLSVSQALSCFAEFASALKCFVIHRPQVGEIMLAYLIQ